MQEYSGKVGYSSEILKTKLEILQTKTPPVVDGEIRVNGKCVFLELSIVIHRIYIQRFLNSSARLVIGPESRKRINGRDIISLNVDEEIENMKELISYFDNWVQWSKDQKKKTG